MFLPGGASQLHSSRTAQLWFLSLCGYFPPLCICCYHTILEGFSLQFPAFQNPSSPVLPSLRSSLSPFIKINCSSLQHLKGPIMSYITVDPWTTQVWTAFVILVLFSPSVVSDSLQPCGLLTHQAPTVLGISQARILEWVAISFSKVSSWPRDRTQVSCIAGGFFSHWATQSGGGGGA